MEARYYKAVDGGVKCLLCPHECQINEGKHGICRSRECHDGKLYSLAYGEACALHVDPVEKNRCCIFFLVVNAFQLQQQVVIFPVRIAKIGKSLKFRLQR